MCSIVPFNVKEPMNLDTAEKYFQELFAAVEAQNSTGHFRRLDLEGFLWAFATTLCQLMPFVINHSEWGGMTSVSDHPIDRYSKVTTIIRSYEFSYRVKDWECLDRSDGHIIWEVSIEDLSSHPDNPSLRVGNFLLQTPSSYANGDYELMRFIVSIWKLYEAREERITA